MRTRSCAWRSSSSLPCRCSSALRRPSSETRARVGLPRLFLDRAGLIRGVADVPFVLADALLGLTHLLFERARLLLHLARGLFGLRQGLLRHARVLFGGGALLLLVPQRLPQA